MRYTLYADNNLIYNPRLVGENGEPTNMVFEPTLSEDTDAFGSLAFSAVKGSPAYAFCTELKTRIKLFRGANLYWTGRIMDITPDIADIRQYYVEDFLGVLTDSMFRPYSFEGTVAEFLEQIVDAHNEQVNANQQFAGVVCDITDTIIRSSIDYASCWQVIKQKLIDMIGGFIWIEYVNGDAILHYSRSPRDTSTQRVNLGENLASFSVKRDFSAFYTACVPLGSKNSGERRLTIAEANNGVDYLIDSTSAAIYGIRFAPPEQTTWDDVTVASNLLARGQAWLQDQASQGIEEINLTAIDLAAVDAAYEEFQWLDSVIVTAKNYNGEFVIKKIQRRLDKPAETQICMGDKRTSMSGTSVSNVTNLTNRIGVIEADYTTTEDVTNSSQTVYNSLLTQLSSIQQDINGIIMAAIQEYTLEIGELPEDATPEQIAEFNEIKESGLATMYQKLAAQLTVQADYIEAVVSRTNDSITDLNGQLLEDMKSIYAFIRLIATGVVIGRGGESGTLIKMKLAGDTLFFFAGDDEDNVTTENALAYFSAEQLVVSNSRIEVLSVGYGDSYMHFSVIGSGNLQCLFLSPRRLNN